MSRELTDAPFDAGAIWARTDAWFAKHGLWTDGVEMEKDLAPLIVGDLGRDDPNAYGVGGLGGPRGGAQGWTDHQSRPS